jgi:hypothetical protein
VHNRGKVIIRKKVWDREVITFVLDGVGAGLALQILLSREPLST